jgi:putative phosphoribosyl transferase
VIANDQEVWVRLGDLALPATVGAPAQAHGTVLFAHGSGSSRHSPRNRMVAHHLQDCGFVTVLLDLLSEQEEVGDAKTGRYRFDVGLLTDRLTGAIDWLSARPEQYPPRLGLFGASTGAAAALAASARRPAEVRAVVSRGGRPDLAEQALAQVWAPTLLIAGGADQTIIELNRQAEAVLGDRARLVVVPGASHLFPETGALEQVADLAGDWFDLYLDPSGPVLDDFPEVSH